MSTPCNAVRGRAICGLGYAHLGAHYDAPRREAWFEGSPPHALVVICNAISHKNNPRGSEVPCTFSMGHDGGHSWGDPTSWPDLPQSGLRIHDAQSPGAPGLDRTDPFEIERAFDAPRPAPDPIPLPELPPGYDPAIHGFGALPAGHREMQGLHPLLTACPPAGRPFARATADALQEVGAAAVRAENRELLREGRGRRHDDNPVHPAHYKSHPSGVEAITIIETMPFNIGTAMKYLWRVDEKGNPIVDLKKAIWYIEREIQRRGQA